jgi:hypothetical protein
MLNLNSKWIFLGRKPMNAILFCSCYTFCAEGPSSKKLGLHYCRTTGKPSHSFRTERINLDTVWAPQKTHIAPTLVLGKLSCKCTGAADQGLYLLASLRQVRHKRVYCTVTLGAQVETGAP